MIAQSHIENLKKLNSDDILSQVQANIFKPHGRTFVWCVFMAFGDEAEENIQKKKNRSAIKSFAFDNDLKITTGEQQQIDADNNRKYQMDGGIVTCLFLSRRGMEKMGVPSNGQEKDGEPFIPKDTSFFQGMADDHVIGRSMDDLGTWESKYYHKASDEFERFIPSIEAKELRNYPIHFMILLADNCETKLNTRKKDIETYFAESCGAETLFVEKGMKKVNTKGEAIEPFGFRDGLSKTPFWSKGRKLLKKNRQIVLDEQMGSYFVFRKLEQDVNVFDQKVNKLTKQLFFKDPTSENGLLSDKDILKDIHNFWEKRQWVEAQLMGRFKDGTPLTLFKKPILYNCSATKKQQDLIEQFNFYRSFDFEEKGAKNAYKADEKGSKCPFYAHIRKVNPRDSTVVETPEGYLKSNNNNQAAPQQPKDDEKTVAIEIRMVRRGIPYEEKTDNGTSTVGLLFMSYHVSILFQYEVIHNKWCLNSFIAKKDRQVDPIIKSGKKGNNYTFSTEWGADKKNETIEINFDDIVIPRGGEYFYTPSIPWFKKLDTISVPDSQQV